MAISAVIETVESGVLETLLRHLFSATSGMMLVVPPQVESEGNDREDRERRDEKVVENIMKTAQMHLVVATLLMTVTFTAGFTLPGGFESNTNSLNTKGWQFY
uniref:PGG domain-containing protein n=1 Tax=Solanum tuberosum TaxID=4113 RepID=M1D671_SOLTU